MSHKNMITGMFNAHLQIRQSLRHCPLTNYNVGSRCDITQQLIINIKATALMTSAQRSFKQSLRHGPMTNGKFKYHCH